MRNAATEFVLRQLEIHSGLDTDKTIEQIFQVGLAAYRRAIGLNLQGRRDEATRELVERLGLCVRALIFLGHDERADQLLAVLGVAVRQANELQRTLQDPGGDGGIET
jgi:hypothetical protein